MPRGAAEGDKVRAGDAFPSTYLKQSDIGDRKVLLTIARVAYETVGQGKDAEDKPVLYFAGKEKGMVLNRGNADAITAINGGDDEMDNWGGLKIVVYVDPNVTFGGKRVGGLRIAAPPKPKPAPRPAQQAQPVRAESEDEAGYREAVAETYHASDDDVPF